MLAQNFQVNVNDDIVVSGNGTAGTPDSGVQTIQGISGGTPVPVSGTVTAANASVGADATTAPTSATEVGGIVSASSPTLTAGNLGPLSITLAGAVRTDSSGTTQPVSGTVAVSAISGALPTGSNAIGSVTVSNFPATQPVSGTVAVSAITGALPAGTNSIGSVVIPVNSPATSTLTQLTLVASTSTSTLASNASRKSFFLYNNSTTATVFIAEAGTASATVWSYKLLPQGSYESPSQCYTGALSYFTTTAAGTLQVTERS